MSAIQEHPNLILQVLACASAVIDRYGKVVDHTRDDGFIVKEEFLCS